MNENKIIKIIIVVLFIILCIILSTFFINDTRLNYENEFITQNNSSDEIVEIDETSTEFNTSISTDIMKNEILEYTGEIVLSDSDIKISGIGITTNNKTVTINKEGIYHITGKISDGNILINAEKQKVQLVLDNVDITSLSTAPINGIKASELIITLKDGTENRLTDSNTYTSFTDTESNEPDGTLFTKTDLIINGTGKLIVNANYLDGIVSKDTIQIVNANIEINSNDDGIRGKDYVLISNTTININSNGDGIKSTNSEDESLGYILIDGGNININSKADGIQAETVLNISNDSNIEIKTEGQINNYEDISSKGLKTGKEITIDSGNINITSTDDSIHSNGNIIINNGKFNLSSNDDGIHADTNILINSGDINISKSYEGIESNYIQINNGNIKINAQDDGINISGGNDLSAMDGRMGQNNFSNVDVSNKKLIINDGNIEVSAIGDGLDSNGGIYINGGNIIVKGPTSGGNGSLDYTTECVVTSGDIIIYGSTGMWQNISNNSEIYSLTFYTSGSSGDNVELKDENGNIIKTFVSEKSFGAVSFTNNEIQKGKTYKLYINDKEITSITAENIVTSNSTLGNGFNNMDRGQGSQEQMNHGQMKQSGKGSR